jgi:Zn-dependent protease with chaperone function
MGPRERLGVVPLVGALILCSACSRPPAPGAEDARGDLTRIKSGSSHAGTGSKRVAPPTKTRRSENSRRTAVRASEQPDASAPIDVVVEKPAVTPLPPRSVSSLRDAARAVAKLSAGDCNSDARAFVVLRNTDAFVRPDANSQRLATIAAGVRVNGVASQGDWRLVLFNDGIWGQRAAYVRCSELELGASAAVRPNSTPSPPLNVVSVRREPPTNLTVDPREKRETLRGYLEWQRGDYVIVDGQRVRWTSGTRMQLGRLPFISSVPGGYEMVVVGRRARDGSLIAERIEAAPNRVVLYESEVVQQFDEVERTWLAAGAMFLANGMQRRNIGRIEDTGASVDRVRRIMNRIVPLYVDAGGIRVHVVDSNEWNARAMANGAIWVNTGLLNDTSDDELAVVLGHELAHYTYEHLRRSMKHDMWRQLAAAGANAAMSATSGRAAQETIATAAKMTLLAWGSGYSRDLEDQANRVGLRYAYEAGFDVERAIDLWSRERSRFGENDAVTNWFSGDHSRPTDRIKNIRRELQLNYRSN